jgi:hypothetical protein
LGANNGALHTTWRNPGVGVGGASVDIGDPGLDKVDMGDDSSTGVLIGIGSAESVGGTWVRSTCGAPVRGGLGDEAEVGSRRG